MKTAIWVVVYLTMCFLLFTGWMFAFAQYAPYNGQEHAFSLTYLLNLFFLHVGLSEHNCFLKSNCTHNNYTFIQLKYSVTTILCQIIFLVV